MRKSTLFIAGPTASGKSSLALRVAEALDGVVINADSMQVYRDLAVVTARPGPAETARIPHALYGTVDGDEAFSAGAWCQYAMVAVEAAWKEGRLPILVGGTGLYFRTIVEGIATVPDIPVDVRAQVRADMAAYGAAHMYNRLRVADPAMAEKLHATDSQRIARALEVIEATGKSLSHYQERTAPGPLKPLLDQGLLTRWVLNWPRAGLYARCDARFEMMINQGALEEVKALLARGLPDDRPVMRALGVSNLSDYLSGHRDLSVAIERAKVQTRRFAKRQLTWFRHQCTDWQAVDAQDMETKTLDLISFMTRKIN